jgi:hypothetical protein
VIPLVELVDRVVRDNAHDAEQAKILRAAIEQERRESNNRNAMKNLDRHFELRGGCFRDEFD